MANDKPVEKQGGSKKTDERQQGQSPDRPDMGPGINPPGGEQLKSDDAKSKKELRREQPDLRQHNQGHAAKQRDAG